jgi:hypothetical protein
VRRCARSARRVTSAGAALFGIGGIQNVSNLIIGIIGVALFIGLALGAAIFLGPRFDDAQNNAYASDAVLAVGQVAAAVSSYRLASGYVQGPALSSTQTLVDGGYLRDVPVNGSYAGHPPQIVDVNGVDVASSGSAGTFQPRYVLMSLGSNQALCTLVEQKLGRLQTGGSVSTDVATLSSVERGNAGCFRTSTGASTIGSGDYVVYSRI